MKELLYSGTICIGLVLAWGDKDSLQKATETPEFACSFNSCRAVILNQGHIPWHPGVLCDSFKGAVGVHTMLALLGLKPKSQEMSRKSRVS